MNDTTDDFAWWHRDEIQVYVVYWIVVFFFGRSLVLELATLSAATIVMLGLWIFRWWRRTGRNPALVRPALRMLPGRSSDRSRLAMSMLSTALVAALLWHRLDLFVRDAAAGIPPDDSFATPVDLYWILFLAWYELVWVVITLFLIAKWRSRVSPTTHRYLEGLVGSMFFYHGLPPRARIVTFSAGMVLGGLPTLFAVRIDPADPGGFLTASLLIIPVAGLIIFGGWFASRWVGPYPPEAS